MIGLHDAVHLGPDGELGVLRVAGARHHAILRENYAVGPCHADPPSHVHLRRAWWLVRGEHVDDAEDLAAVLKHVPATLDAADWIDGAWRSWLRRWWVMHSWLLGRIKRPLWLVPPGAHRAEGAAAALGRAEIADAPKREQGELLWRAFAGPDPREFDRLRRLLDLDVARAHGAFFAVAEGKRIDLSPYDRLLLEGLTVREWRSIRDLLRDRSEALGWWMSDFGDKDVVERLLLWTRHPAKAPALEMRTLRSGGFLIASEFRLTRAGRKLLDGGTRDPSELAPRAVGGAEATRWLRRALADGDYELIAR
jgi:hypothetical protein